MTPFFDEDGATLYQGHALALLRSLPDACVQTCVTSPPYYGLRAYGTEPQVWGGERACEHRFEEKARTLEVGAKRTPSFDCADDDKYRPVVHDATGATCALCGAWRGELGLEPHPALFIEHLTEIFREVKRVLRDDGTVWCNLGDSYSGGGGYSPDAPSNRARQERLATGDDRDGSFTVRGEHNYRARRGTGDVPGLPAKNLLGMPWRLAFALQDDGWILRSDVIWSKPNPMPESVRDRPTKSHEYLFLLAKRSRYFYDADAIAEDAIRAGESVALGAKSLGRRALANTGKAPWGNAAKASVTVAPRRNKRTVWTICPKSFREAHFATFPPALVEPCILAGTSAAGECPHCGAAWERVVETTRTPPQSRHDFFGARGDGRQNHHGQGAGGCSRITATDTLGWRKRCSCPRHAPTPQTVLDPFSGAATTGLVALQHGRRYIGLELQESYLQMSARRLSSALPQKKAA